MTLMAIYIVLLFLGLSAIFDLYCRRVPNYITGISTAIGLIFPWISSGSINVASAYIGGMLALMILLLPYQFGAIGAGDVKLFGAAGLFLGVNEVISASICVALMGGLLSLIYLLGNAASILLWRKKILNAAPNSIELPYAVAIFGGVLFLILRERIS